MVEKMDDAATTLRLLQNDVRRGILERLVREPHYPMQLADLLNVSQPAINKHLKELERGGLVTKEKVPSDKGGRQSASTASLRRFRSASIWGLTCFASSSATCPKAVRCA